MARWAVLIGHSAVKWTPKGSLIEWQRRQKRRRKHFAVLQLFDDNDSLISPETAPLLTHPPPTRRPKLNCYILLRRDGATYLGSWLLGRLLFTSGGWSGLRAHETRNERRQRLWLMRQVTGRWSSRRWLTAGDVHTAAAARRTRSGSFTAAGTRRHVVSNRRLDDVQFGFGLRKEVLNHHKINKFLCKWVTKKWNKNRRNGAECATKTSAPDTDQLDNWWRRHLFLPLVTLDADAVFNRFVRPIQPMTRSIESIYWPPLNVFTMNRRTLQSDCVLPSGGHRSNGI